MENKKKLNKELIIKILILVILIILIGITSFRSGNKFYLLKNMYLDDKTLAETKTTVARWNFSARIIYNDEISLRKEGNN